MRRNTVALFAVVALASIGLAACAPTTVPPLPTPAQVAGCYRANADWGDHDLQIAVDGTLTLHASVSGLCSGPPVVTRNYLIAADAAAAASACDVANGQPSGTLVAGPVQGAVYPGPGLEAVWTCAVVAGGVPSGGGALPTEASLQGCYTPTALGFDVALYRGGTWVMWPGTQDRTCGEDPGGRGQYVIADTSAVASALCSATPGGAGFLSGTAVPLLADPAPYAALGVVWNCT